ncbi:hypothetical protein BGX28_008719 [Mortierella sp. GBA30]|nr:hypothetical protein BGX28_008719 [Mortierella sp. GBA30]
MSSPKNSSSTEPIPYRSSRWPGRLLVWLGIGHNVAGFLKSDIRNPFVDALKAGFVNQFDSSADRRHSLWFFIAGLKMMMLGKVINYYLFPEDVVKDKPRKRIQRSDKVLPRTVGVWFVGLGLIGAAAIPKSGFYLLIAEGLSILLFE